MTVAPVDMYCLVLGLTLVTVCCCYDKARPELTIESNIDLCSIS